MGAKDKEAVQLRHGQPAAPRVREAAQLRAQLLRGPLHPRYVARAIADIMKMTPEGVRGLLKRYDLNPEKYDDGKKP